MDEDWAAKHVESYPKEIVTVWQYKCYTHYTQIIVKMD